MSTDDDVLRQLFFNLTKPLFSRSPRDYEAEETIEAMARLEFLLALKIRGAHPVPTNDRVNALSQDNIDIENLYRKIDAMSSEGKRHLEDGCNWKLQELPGTPVEKSLHSMFPILTMLEVNNSPISPPGTTALKLKEEVKKIISAIECGVFPVPAHQLTNASIRYYSPSDQPNSEVMVMAWTQMASAWGKLVLLTAFHAKLPRMGLLRDRRSFYFYPDHLPRTLFGQLSCEQDRPIILTDCLELAHINQPSDGLCAWVSWDNRPGSIDKYDWTPLKDTTVYYLLLEHSGASPAQIIETALLIQAKLHGIVSKFKFISYLSSFTSSTPTRANRSDPWLLSRRELQLKLDEAVSHKKLESTREAALTNRPVFQPREISERCILNPLIRAGSINLIFSVLPLPPGDRLRFLTSMAYALAIGKPLIKEWVTPRDVRAHFHGGSYSLDELNAAFAGVTGPIPDVAMQSRLTVSVSPKESDDLRLNVDYSFIHIPEAQDGDQVMFIENVNCADYALNRIPVQEFKCFLESTAQKGWTIIISGDGMKDAQATTWGKAMSFDSIIKLSRPAESRSQNPELMVRVLKKPKGLTKAITPIIIEFVGRASDVDPSLWRRARRSHVKGGIMKELELISAYLTAGWKGPEISSKTGIGYPLVRKRMAQLNGKVAHDPRTGIWYHLERNKRTGEVVLIRAWDKDVESTERKILFKPPVKPVKSVKNKPHKK